MTEQEFLAASLPHKLKVAEFNDDGDIIRIEEIYGGRYEMYCQHSYYKSILHPLSDLTKQIPFNGIITTPIEILGFFNMSSHYQELLDEIKYEHLSVARLRTLLILHFDIADLISKGEAIDVNELPENPYK